MLEFQRLSTAFERQSQLPSAEVFDGVTLDINDCFVRNSTDGLKLSEQDSRGTQNNSNNST